MRDLGDNLGETVKTARKDYGFTQEQAAEQVGIGVRHYMAIENEGKYPGYEVLCRMIQIFNIPADLIFRPEAVTRTVEQEQFIIEFLSCNEQEKRIVRETTRSLIRELRKR